MQPKRDPSDRRFWPVRLGGTSGFSDYHRKGQPSPYRYGSLSNRGSLAHRQQPARAATSLNTVTEQAKQLVDADAVRARARLLTIAVMDDLDARRSSMDDGKLVDALNAAGKLTGVQVTTQNVTGSVAHLHLDALRQLSAERRLSNSSDAPTTVSARVLPKSTSDSGLVEVEGDSVSPEPEGDEREAEESLGRS